MFPITPFMHPDFSPAFYRPRRARRNDDDSLGMVNPFHDIFDDAASAFALAHSHDAQAAQSRRHIKIDVDETEEAFHVAADVPGFSKDDIKLNLEGQILTITASHADRGSSNNAQDDGYKGKIMDAEHDEDLDELDNANGNQEVADAKQNEELSESRQNHIRERAWYRSEQVSRSIRLPKTIAADQAEANYENGVLRVDIPKRTISSRITIN